MFSYTEDQKNELEVLESIYSNELEIIELEPFPKFLINLSTDDYKDNQVRLSVKIQFTFSEKYPNELPKIEIVSYADDFKEEYKNILEELILEEANRNIGIVMVFNLVCFVNEWLSNKVEDLKKILEEEHQKKLNALQREEQIKLEGTKVTLESFMKWKTKFDEENGEALQKLKLESNKKATGRQLFEKDASLAKSDLQFIKDEEDVCIDETLFENFDELDINDEDSEEDDSDFDPDDFTDTD